jgi:hypothetical protein
VDALNAILIAINFALSIWNSYAAGFNFGILRKSSGPFWLYAYSAIGLIIGVVGEAYVLSVVIGLVALNYGYVSADTIALLVGYEFLIFGGLIVILGIGITITSIYIAVKNPGPWTIGGSIWNVFASVWNVFTYVKNFGLAASLIKSEEREGSKADEGSALVLAATAVLIAILISYVAFRAGRDHAIGDDSISDENL